MARYSGPRRRVGAEAGGWAAMRWAACPACGLLRRVGAEQFSSGDWRCRNLDKCQGRRKARGLDRLERASGDGAGGLF